MSDLQAIADRVEIEALRGELADAVMMRDYDRAASLSTHNGAVRIPHINVEAVGREALRAGAERQQALLDYFGSARQPPRHTAAGPGGRLYLQPGLGLGGRRSHNVYGWLSQWRRRAAVSSAARSSGKNSRAPSISTTSVAPGMVSRSQ